MTVVIDPIVFREYDIRGDVGKNLTPEFAYVLGRAYGSLVRESGALRVAIGRDCRPSSEAYEQGLARGINDEGVDVVLTGMGPTPQLYYAIYAESLGGGIQVTGSHNPPEMNGFKLCLGTATLSGAQIQDLYRRCLALRDAAPQEKKGATTALPLRNRYIDMLVENSLGHMGQRKLKVVVDAGNGVGGLVGPEVLRKLGVEVIELFCEPDGSFPNHHPDPTVMENIQVLIARVKAEKADFGIGWDGDADRIGVVDEQGRPIFGDMLLMLYARQILAEQPGATIIGDVKCSSILFEDIRAHGGSPIMWKTGHSLIKGKLRETQGALAGEMSGHIFFKHRYFGFDDALYASSRIVELVSKFDGPVSTMLAGIPQTVATPEIRVDCPERVKFQIMSKAQEKFSDYPVDTTDGVRISFPHGWGLLRASNTQPVLVMRFEATTESEIRTYESVVRSRLAEIRAEVS